MSRLAIAVARSLAPLALVACDDPTPSAAESACRAVSAAAVGRQFGHPATSAARGENGCLWVPRDAKGTEPAARLLVEVVTPERIADAGFADAETYFLVAAPQVGVAFGGEAEEVAGIGDRAVWGGGPGGGELWVLDGGRLVGLIGEGIDREALVSLASTIATPASAGEPESGRSGP